MSTSNNEIITQDELVLSFNDYLFLKEDLLSLEKDLLFIAEKKDFDEGNSKLYQKKIHFHKEKSHDALSLEKPQNLEFETLKDPISLKAYQISKPIKLDGFNPREELSYQVFVEKNSAQIFCLPGKLTDFEKGSYNKENPYKVSFEGNFSFGDDKALKFHYRGKFIAFNHFFGFILQEAISVEKLEYELEEHLKFLEKVKTLFSPFWNEKKHFFFKKGDEEKTHKIY